MSNQDFENRFIYSKSWGRHVQNISQLEHVCGKELKKLKKTVELDDRFLHNDKQPILVAIGFKIKIVRTSNEHLGILHVWNVL